MCRFNGAAGQAVSVWASSVFFEPTIHLVSPTGERVARDDGGIRNRLGAHEARLAVLLPTDGEYEIRVATNGPVRGGPYEVRLGMSTVTPLDVERTGGRRRA